MLRLGSLKLIYITKTEWTDAINKQNAATVQCEKNSRYRVPIQRMKQNEKGTRWRLPDFSRLSVLFKRSVCYFPFWSIGETKRKDVLWLKFIAGWNFEEQCGNCGENLELSSLFCQKITNRSATAPKPNHCELFTNFLPAGEQQQELNVTPTDHFLPLPSCRVVLTECKGGKNLLEFVNTSRLEVTDNTSKCENQPFLRWRWQDDVWA